MLTNRNGFIGMWLLPTSMPPLYILSSSLCWRR